MKETENTEELEIDLLRLFMAMWHRLWAIILAAVLFGGLALSYAMFAIAPTYQAKALMYVNNSSISVGNTSVSISSGELSAAQTLVDTYVVILKTRTTLEEVIREADLPYTYEQLNRMVESGPVNSTQIFEIKVTSTDPAEAEMIANTITRVLPGKIASVVDGSSVRVVDFAVIPAHKAGPSYTKYAAVGIMLGVLLSCGIIVVLELMDDQIHSEDYLTQTYDTPLLSVIPDLTEAQSSSYYYKGYGSTSKDPETKGWGG